MKSYHLMHGLQVVTILIFLSTCTQKTTTNIEVAGIVPIPNEVIKLEGSFKLNDKSKIIVSNEKISEIGQLFANELNIHRVSISNKKITNSVSLSIDTILEPEGYHIKVTSNNIIIRGGGSAGIFYALQTLLQLKTNNGFPAVEIKDAPRFSYRGMMLDVSRYFFSVKDVKQFIDIIALHKYNKFHWHLTDDQGWRIEIKKYPKLTEVGSIRKETMAGDFRDSHVRKVLWEAQGEWDFRKDYIPDPKDFDGKPHIGFYTQEDIKEIVTYAASKFIEVIPEIDVPGHFSAALAAYPEFGCKENYEVSTRWSVHPNIICPSEESIVFVQDILTEVMELFPSEYVHIGGDEANKTHWEDSKFCQDFIKKNALRDEIGLQSYFIGRLDEFLALNGKNLIGWDEILEGGLSKNATVMSWRGEIGGIEAATHNHNVIMSPSSHTYFDMYQDSLEFKQKKPLAQWGVTLLKKVYDYNPLPSELSSKEQKYIIGAEGCMWTEYISTIEYLEYMTLPRAAALAEVVWSSPENKNWDNFNIRLLNLFKVYDEKGYNYAKHSLKK